MLALGRRVGQRIFIGDPANPLVIITVASIRGDKVRFSFDAPTGLQIHREEVAKAIVAGVPQGEAKAKNGGTNEQ